MEEDSRGEFSEDEHPSTDASEDSVEVQVNPITRPYHPNLSRLPRKFRKAFERTSFFKEEVSVSQVSSKGRETPPSSVDFSVTSSVTTGRASITCPPSPPSTARIRGSRRKPSEPRRVVEQEGSKRPAEEEWHPRKTPRTEVAIATPLPPNIPSSHSILAPNPFLGHFVPPQFLLPSAWAHVARHPYAHLVGLAPQLGLLPSSPYPLLPILPSRLQVPQQISPNPQSSEYHGENLRRSDSSSKKLNGLSDRPQLITKKVLSPNDEILQPLIPSSNTVTPNRPPSSVDRKPTSKPSTKHFHSVESLISSVTPKEEDVEIVEEEFDDLPQGGLRSESPSQDDTIQCLLQTQSRQKQRNYKNMTRERRIEANARERTRVHTISAAFETLRQCVPSFSHNQKLSKLSVLRIASAYILSLSKLAGHDYNHGEANLTFAECVDLTTKTIQIEGKAKKKRDD